MILSGANLSDCETVASIEFDSTQSFSAPPSFIEVRYELTLHAQSSICACKFVTVILIPNLLCKIIGTKCKAMMFIIIFQDCNLILNDLRKSKDLCDVVIKVGSETYHAHRVVLASKSPYFLGMFKSNMVESQQTEITLTGIYSSGADS